MRKLLGLVLILFNANVFSETIECVSLVKNNTIDVELKKDDGFANCFLLEGNPQNTPLQIVAFSGDSVRNKIILFNMNSSGVSTYISEYSSGTSSANAAEINTTNRNISFVIQPTSHLNTNINLSASYAMLDGQAVVFLELMDVDAISAPVIESGCSIIGGTRVCEDER